MKKSRSQNKTYNRSGARRFFLLSVMCLLVVLIIASIVYWQWEGISSWVSETAIGITQVFGWGLVLIVLAVLTLTVVILTYPRVLWHFWNRWIGGLIAWRR